jgi:hypothetical protein
MYLQAAAPQDPLGVPDAALVMKMERENKEQEAHLETSLKIAKNNLVKDCIRVCRASVPRVRGSLC